jgi:adenylate cyclase
MALEIERKFLVRSDAWRAIAASRADIRQAYLASGERSTTRVRIKNGSQASVTIKSRREAMSRLEVEYPISIFDAEALMPLRQGGLIEKTRFTVPWCLHTWDVDVFAADNLGLVLAEIELRHEDESFEQPRWLGIEVTGQSRYYNSSLARHPFACWEQPFDRHDPILVRERGVNAARPI